MAFSSIQRIHFPVIASTNTWVKQNTAQLAPDPRTLCVVSTDHQTAGRGTGDRNWEAEPGASILATLFFRVPQKTSQIPFLTSVLALSVVEAINANIVQSDQVEQQAVTVKWPNDIIVNDCKVGGILSECTVKSEQFEVMLGLGLNVNNTADQLATIARPRWPASSLVVQTGISWERDQLQEQIATRFGENMEIFLSEQGSLLVQRLANVSLLKNRWVVLTEGEVQHEGHFGGLAPDGGLIIHLNGDHQNQRIFYSAEITKLTEE